MVTVDNPKHLSPAKLPRIVVYLPSDLKEKLEKLASLEHRPVSNMVLALIAKAIEEAESDGRLQ